MKNFEKAQKLRKSVDLLLDTMAEVNEVIGDTDAGVDTIDAIEDVIEDLMCDIADLEAPI